VGDFLFQQKCENRIRELIESENVTVLLVSHDIGLVERMCNRVCWIEKGQQRMVGPTQEVCAAYRSLGQ
jgi:ABC-2 type transport system ATP-binding protein